MAKYKSDRKRVAKNTVLLYIRMIIVMGVSLFTSRVILESLGVEDYGVYNIVGGIAYSFGFFSSALTNAIQRYLSFGHGEGSIEKVRNYLSIITIIFLIFCGIIAVAGGAAGYWIVSLLNIPAHLFSSAIWIYYTTLVSLIITLLCSIFDSVLIAREDMNVYAYLSIAEAAFKLGIAYILFSIPSERLIVYGLLSLAATAIVKTSIIIYTYRKYEECKFHLKWNKSKIREIYGFIGWNGLGTASFAINEQGINILFNLFFGPVVNAARGISYQVSSAINNFTSNFFMAMNPQIIRTYAAGDYKDCVRLMQQASIFSFFLLWLICLPVMLRRDYILNIWLTDVPDCTSQLLLWILVYNLINILTQPQWTVIRAIGKLKRYMITGSILMLATIPVGYTGLKTGLPPQSIIIVMSALRLVYVCVSLTNIRKYIDFSIRGYVKCVFLPIAAIVLISASSSIVADFYIPDNFPGLIMVVLFTIAISSLSMIMFLHKNIRTSILATIKHHIKR